MTENSWLLIISSGIIWIPVINLVFRNTALSKLVFNLTYISLFICPIVSVINIIVVLRVWSIEKTFNIANILVLLANILFLVVGMKYLKSVAWVI